MMWITPFVHSISAVVTLAPLTVTPSVPFGHAGLRILQSRAQINLLVTDVGLPSLNGRQLADQARVSRPNLKVIFITGYAESAAVSSSFLDPGMAMITKPFAPDMLMVRIRMMIEEPL